MQHDMRFALVLPIRSQNCPYDFAVCNVDDESCAVTFVDFSDLAEYTDGVPCVPSIYGDIPGIVSILAEQRALEAIENSVSSFAQKYEHEPPSHYEKLLECRSGGLTVHIRDGRLSFEIAEWECKGLRWHRGDRISVAMSALQRQAKFAVYLDRDGFVLGDSEKSGWLTANRDWPIPGSDFKNHDNSEIEYYTTENGLYFTLANHENVSIDHLSNIVMDETCGDDTFRQKKYSKKTILSHLFFALLLSTIFIVISTMF